MDYIKDAFDRMDLQQIRQFLLYGVEEFDCDSQSYKDRLKNGSDPIYRRLKELYPVEDEREKVSAELAQALTAFESVYMEMGMKAGARLICQLLFEDGQSPGEAERNTRTEK